MNRGSRWAAALEAVRLCPVKGTPATVNAWRAAAREAQWPTPAHYAVASLIADYADWETGRNARPPFSRIGDRLDLGARQISRLARDVQALGWLRLTSPPSTGKANVYALTVPTRSIGDVPTPVMDDRGVTGDRGVTDGGGVMDDGGGMSSVTGESSHGCRPTSTTPPPLPLPREFAAGASNSSSSADAIDGRFTIEGETYEMDTNETPRVKAIRALVEAKLLNVPKFADDLSLSPHASRRLFEEAALDDLEDGAIASAVFVDEMAARRRSA